MVHSVRSLAALVLAAFIGFVAPAAAQPINPNELIILTTTTTQDSGILRVLTDAFAKKSGLAVKAIVAGSGDILKQGARGEGMFCSRTRPQPRRPGWRTETAPRASL